jgi:16S rRNA (cytidine1402-2'-O)-methyltransferase
MSTFSVIATPIGNLEDITLRALKVLGSVDLILCEDTRMTKRLLDRHTISAKTLSYHAHSTLSRVEEIISLLKEGKNLALVSDAGTPGISDPGAELVRRIREEMENEIAAGELKIESVPGPSALTAVLSIAGVACADFTFLGFLPHKKGRETLFKEIAASERTMIFYESPHRIIKTLESLKEHLHDTQKKVSVGRELTKVFEEIVSGTAEEVLSYFAAHGDKVRGEFVVIVS